MSNAETHLIKAASAQGVLFRFVSRGMPALLGWWRLTVSRDEAASFPVPWRLRTARPEILGEAAYAISSRLKSAGCRPGGRAESPPLYTPEIKPGEAALPVQFLCARCAGDLRRDVRGKGWRLQVGRGSILRWGRTEMAATNV